MNLIDDLKQKKGINNNSFFYTHEDVTGYDRTSQSDILKKGFLGNQDVYSVVSRCARLCANLPIDIQNRGEKVEDNDEFLQFFTKQWGKQVGGNEGLYALYVNLFLFGRVYIYKEEESIGFGTSMQWVLPTQNVCPESTNSSYFTEPQYYDFQDGNVTHRYTPDQLIIIKYYDPSDLIHEKNGLSPLQSVFKTVEAGNNRNQAEASLMNNRGISGFISPKANGSGGAFGMREEVMELIRGVFSKLTGGASKFNKVEVIEDPVEFTQLGLSSSDLSLIELRLNHVRDICNAYGVPSLLWNDYQSRTHANYREAKLALYNDFIIPQTELVISQYSQSVVDEFNGRFNAEYKMKINKAEIDALKPEYSELVSNTIQLFEKGLLSLSEARVKLNMPEEVDTMEAEGLDLLRSLPPTLMQAVIGLMTEEEKQRIVEQLGL